jgi:uncharacterized protein (TIGR02246 family)
MLARQESRVRFVILATTVAAACVLTAVVTAWGQNQPKSTPKANSGPARTPAARSAPSGDEAAIRASSADYEKTFNKGDAKAVAAFWTSDGELVDETGRVLKGREAIEKEFATIFADQAGAQIEVHTDSIKFLTPEVAIESGTTRARSANTPAGPPVKYTAVLVKGDGKWLLSNVSESPANGTSNARNLASLDWLVGEWKADLGDGKTYRMSCQWMPEKSFLSRTFSATEGDRTLSSGTQIIGWSPLIGGVVSWTFDSSGGVGHEMWEDHGNRWRIDASSLLADGQTSLATNLMNKIDDNTFTWRSVERSLNEKLLPDTAEVRVQRVSK